MHMLGIGAGDRNPDLIGEVHVDIEIGANQLHQFDVFEINHIASVTTPDQRSLQLLLKAFHGIAKHDLLKLSLFYGVDRHVVIGRLHKEDIGRFDGKPKLLGLVPESDHLLLLEFLGGIFSQILQFGMLVLHGEIEP